MPNETTKLTLPRPPEWHLVKRVEWGNFETPLVRRMYYHADAPRGLRRQVETEVVRNLPPLGVPPNLVAVLLEDTLDLRNTDFFVDAGEYAVIVDRLSKFPVRTLQFMPYEAIMAAGRQVLGPEPYHATDLLYRAMRMQTDSHPAMVYRMALEGRPVEDVWGITARWAECGFREVEWRVLQNPLAWTPEALQKRGTDLNHFELHTTSLMRDKRMSEDVSDKVLFEFQQLPPIGGFRL